MNTIIFDLINKIDYLTRIPKKIEIGSKLAREQYIELTRRFPDMQEDKRLGIANLLQDYNLRDFTDEELITLSNLKLELLFHNPNQKVEKQILYGNKLFDSGSIRVYSLLYKNNINFENLEYLRAINASTPINIIESLATLYI
ncbi:hypothetical protein V6O07_22940 [Arthrospira platensis SPKY2]